jgi:hypothetical protein
MERRRYRFYLHNVLLKDTHWYSDKQGMKMGKVENVD